MASRNAFFLLPLAMWLAACGSLPAEDSDSLRLYDIKLKLMSADYRADLDELARGRELLTTLKDHPTLGYVAYYWSAFAGIRLAINGSNRRTSNQELERNLRAALRDAEEGLLLKEDFADTHVLAGHVASWMAAITIRREAGGLEKFKEGGKAVLSEETRSWIDRTWKHLRRARELAPKNPRLPWVEAAIWYNVPPERGGSQAKAVTMYREALALARAERVTDPLWPDWGEPEALMSLAWCLLNGSSPDPAAARDSAEDALRVRPDWYYIREILRPQIEQALRREVRQ
ncbi:MAG TPA: hypothetical protein VKJ00_13230 [Thermoanaerobaculia bacterium]|nr:hypothetical protein [Thermoanaerobaculia bacterium]